MPAQVLSTTENNFTKGLLTEFTGLNFPENAATDTDNCVYTLVGDVTRRYGIDVEANHSLNPVGSNSLAISSYKWNNAGGNGESQIVVVQVGIVLYFYLSSNTSVFSSLSSQLLASSINFSGFVVSGSPSAASQVECQFTDGNGYLFVTHPNCDPFYCTYNVANNTITPTVITLQTRDFLGTDPSEYPINLRPGNLTLTHEYNIQNQGWNSSAAWSAGSTSSNLVGTGLRSFNLGSGSLPIVQGQTVGAIATAITSSGVPGSSTVYYTLIGNVLSYSGGILTIYVGTYDTTHQGTSYSSWTVVNITGGAFPIWFNAVGTYPSNADVWWNYKDSTDQFNPASTLNNTTFNTGPAPKGSYILDEFNQQRAVVSGLSGIQPVVTNSRPSTVSWFAGRVFYTGVDSPSDIATGYSWSENIYFSQIVTTGNTAQFGYCYQQNDPTSELLFDLLPTDGGVITIQGCGFIYKLFPIANGMLIFAANGVWFLTGSQGIGFSANDYTITKISAIRSISSYSFVDVNGLPYFWNEEGIYLVEPQQGGSLAVNPITVGTIQTFYNDIPLVSKVYARAAYDPINYYIQWIYRSTEEVGISNRYYYDGVLNFNTYNKSFYPYTVDTTLMAISSAIYISSPGGTNTPDSTIKFLATGASGVTFAQEFDPSYLDWHSKGGVNFESYFITGYKVHGQAQRRFQMPYIYMYSRNDVPNSYNIQGLWDYAIVGNSGRWSTLQRINIFNPNFGTAIKRHRIRGRGLVLQIKVSSTDGMPFDIMGWSTFETANTGV